MEWEADPGSEAGHLRVRQIRDGQMGRNLVWLANERAWTNDLALRTRREVRLKPIVGGIDASAVAAGAATIAELGWRDFWS